MWRPLQLCADAFYILWTVGDRLRNVYRNSTTEDIRTVDFYRSLRIGIMFGLLSALLVRRDVGQYLSHHHHSARALPQASS